MIPFWTFLFQCPPFLVPLNIYSLLEKLHGTKWNHRTSWVFCGHRRPWVEVTSSNVAAIVLKQINIENFAKTVMHYEAYDDNLTLSFLELFYMNKITIPNIPVFVLGRLLTYHLLAIRFHVIGEPGEIIQFLACRCRHCEATMSIFDGFDLYYQLDELDLNSTNVVNIDKVTRYFHAHVVVSFRSLGQIRRRDWKMKLSRKLKKHKIITDSRNLTIQNIESGNIAHYVYRVHLENEQFPMISIIKRKFVGFNENGCASGCILLTEFTNIKDTMNNNTYGPYCPNLVLNQPFLASDGLKTITYPNKHIQIVIFGFYPLFTIDIDLVITTSVCEGILNPVTVCNSAFNDTIQSGITESNILTRRKSYEFYCLEIFYETFRKLHMYIYNIEGCILIQELPTRYDLNYVLKIFSPVEAELHLYTWADSSQLHNRKYWNSVGFHFSTKAIVSDTVSGFVSVRDIPFVKILYETEYSSTKLSYSLKLLTKNYKKQKCYRYNETSHQLWEVDKARDQYLLIANSICGTGHYQKNYIYIFTFSPLYEHDLKRKAKLLIYFSIRRNFTKDCITSDTANSEEDEITTQLPGTSISALRASKDVHTLTISSLERSLSYIKNNNCSTVLIQFRYVQHILLTKPLIDNIRGVILKVLC